LSIFPGKNILLSHSEISFKLFWQNNEWMFLGNKFFPMLNVHLLMDEREDCLFCCQIVKNIFAIKLLIQLPYQ
jgi:hypothetical protein